LKSRQFSVIGYGRFGQLWADILSMHGEVFVYDKFFNKPSHPPLRFVPLKVALRKDIIFLCIPISKMEEFLAENGSQIPSDSIVVDTASVKVFPLEWMDKYLPNTPHIGTHPLFGPDSYYHNEKNTVILCRSLAYPDLIAPMQTLFEKMAFELVIMEAADHDYHIAHTQGITHLIGNIFIHLGLPEGLTPTRGFKLLQAVGQFCQNDTDQLFRDMLSYNPITQAMMNRFSEATHTVYQNVFQKNSANGQRIGIMGVEGSFSHQAAMAWQSGKGQNTAACHFLITAEGVIGALERGEIDTGFLAIQNGAGGVVLETIEGLARHGHLHIIEYYPFIVEQTLLKHPHCTNSAPAAIHSHPQALKQCDLYLRKNFPGIRLIPEEDTALAAKKLSEGQLPQDVWVIAASVCSELYRLDIAAEKIQTLEHNLTDFIIIKG
jgi:prephenate dehydrogenase